MNDKILRKQLIIFFLIAFGLPYLMGIPMYMVKSKGGDIEIFPIFQMMTPALAAMAAQMLGGGKMNKVPKKFYLTYIVFSLVLLGLSIISLASKKGLVVNLTIILASLLVLLSYFLEDKKTRALYKLDWPQKKKMVLAILIFLVPYIGRSWISSSLAGEDLWQYFDLDRLVFGIILIPNFFLSFIPFFGEEYGWRYFLQPILQKKYGMIGGVLILGILWGLWHLPLNLFYYSAGGTGLISLATQIVTCITMSIFMAFAYNYTGNIWTAVWIHYINNNFILLFVENMDPSVIVGNTYSWPIFWTHLVSSLIFLPFVLSKYVRNKDYRVKSSLELLEEGSDENED